LEKLVGVIDRHISLADAVADLAKNNPAKTP